MESENTRAKRCNKEEIDGSTKYGNGCCGGRGVSCDGMVNKEDTEVDIEEKCYNCDNYNECFDGDDYSTDCDGGFEPREDLVELHGKLRKAVKVLRKIKDSDAGCEILWQAKDTDGSWYDVHVDDYIDEVLEELQ